MNTVVGLFLALVGLFLVWLWSSGRAQAVWQDLWQGSSSSGFTPGGGGNFGGGASGSWDTALGNPLSNSWASNILQGVGGQPPSSTNTGNGGYGGSGVSYGV